MKSEATISPERERPARFLNIAGKLPALAIACIAGALSFLVRLPAQALLLLIRLYQRTLSPALPVFFGSACGCRFTPTCSHYAADAIRTRGVVIGVMLSAIRLVKCTPLHPGGFDPVPERHGNEALRFFNPSCRRSGLVDSSRGIAVASPRGSLVPSPGAPSFGRPVVASSRRLA